MSDTISSAPSQQPDAAPAAPSESAATPAKKGSKDQQVRRPSMNYHPMALFDTVVHPRHSVSHPQDHQGSTDETSHAGRHQRHQHHFHFPPSTTAWSRFQHKLASERDKIAHLASSAHPYVVGPTNRSSSASSWLPRTDIRETKNAYHIEIEVPGVTDKEKLLIQWSSPRTLLVEGKSGRPVVTGPLKGETVWEQEGDTIENTTQGAASTEQDDDEPQFLLEERNVGPWQRTFTLPVGVDLEALRAKLEGGLLLIEIPKRDLTGEPRTKVEIE